VHEHERLEAMRVVRGAELVEADQEDAQNVRFGSATFMPRFTPMAWSATSSASVPLAHETTCGTASTEATFFSTAATRGPPTNSVLSRHAVQSSSTSFRKRVTRRFKSMKGMGPLACMKRPFL
jgi:hypothetical protein